jgi:hypothetical protein
MHTARKLFATSMIASAGALGAALALSAPAIAEPAPAPPAIPSVPGLSFLDPANAPLLLQGLSTTFSQMTSPATAVAPAAPTAPTATASVNLPQPAALPAPVNALGLPTAAAPAAAPAAATPAQGIVPSAEVSIPQVPGSPLPPQQLAFPGALTSLIPEGVPLANLLPQPATAAAAAAPAAAPAATATATGVQSLESLAPLVFPASALP